MQNIYNHNHLRRATGRPPVNTRVHIGWGTGAGIYANITPQQANLDGYQPGHYLATITQVALEGNLPLFLVRYRQQYGAQNLWTHQGTQTPPADEARYDALFGNLWRQPRYYVIEGELEAVDLILYNPTPQVVTPNYIATVLLTTQQATALQEHNF